MKTNFVCSLVLPILCIGISTVAFGNSQPIDAVKNLNQQLRRAELVREYERATLGRVAALNSWQNLHARRESVADFEERERELRSQYFMVREYSNRVLRELNKLDH